MIIDYGETWSSPTYQVRDANDNLADAGTVTYVITSQVDGSSLMTGTAVHGATGEYTVDWPAGTFSGPASIVVTATGGALGAFTKKWTDQFTVDEQGYVPFVSVDEALAHMRAQDTITDPDDLEQLRWLCQVACDAVERDVGRVIGRRTVIDYFDGGPYELRLRKIPLRPNDGGMITMGSVTENGVALVQNVGYTLRRSTWRLVRGTNLAPFQWWPAIENVVVTYTVSTNPVPRTARKVALNAVQRMWQGSQQSPMPYSDDISADNAIGAAIAGTLTPIELSAYRSLKRILSA